MLLIVFLICIRSLNILGDENEGYCRRTDDHPDKWNDICKEQQGMDDHAESLIKEIYTSVKRAELSLANPNDYLQHYSPKNEEEFDFIVIGAGSAGSVIANRLSEVSRWTVLLLEAGDNPTKITEVPAMHANIIDSKLDWGYETESDEDNCLGMVNNKCKWPRGKVLGGSSSINGNIYVRGNPKDYDSWAAAGNRGWDYKSVLHYFKKSEDVKAKEVLDNIDYKNYHGVSGYLKVDSWRDEEIKHLLVPYSEGMEELGYKYNDDCNGQSQTGFVKLQGTLLEGKRCSTAKAFLKPLKNRNNVKISKKSTATKLLINKTTNTAFGVEYINDEGKVITIVAKKEIIVSAGAVNSPQLLMLSGIGPKQHLQQLGIHVVQDLPVGENLQDHLLMVGLLMGHNQTRVVQSLQQQMYDFLLSNSSALSGQGLLAYSAFINTIDNNNGYPDIQFHHYDFEPNDYKKLSDGLKALGIRNDIEKLYHDINSKSSSIFIMPTLLRPVGRGQVLLKTKNPLDKPKILSGYFSDGGNDLETLLRATDFIYNFTKTKSMQKIGAVLYEIIPPACKDYPLSSKESRVCALKHMSTTCYHPTSTCKMGPADDPTSVVTPTLQVKGIKGLRVADASVMPTITSGNTNAPTIMIGEKASDLVKETWL